MFSPSHKKYAKIRLSKILFSMKQFKPKKRFRRKNNIYEYNAYENDGFKIPQNSMSSKMQYKLNKVEK